MAKWKKGRGKLGPLEPLLGAWVAEADSPMGRLKCTRTFAKMGGEGKWVTLVADWDFGGKHYIEQAIYGPAMTANLHSGPLRLMANAQWDILPTVAMFIPKRSALKRRCLRASREWSIGPAITTR